MVEIRKLSKNSNFFLLIIIFLIFLLSNIINYNHQIINTVSADSNWIQNTKNDFLNGTINNVTITPNGEIKLVSYMKYLEDDFIDESKISNKKNVVIDNKNDRIYLLKIHNTYGGIYHDVGHSIQQTSDGGYIIIGETDSFGTGMSDTYFIKTDEFGKEIWNRTFGGTQCEYGFSVQQTIDNGYILVGKTASYGSGKDDVYLIKTDSYGNEVWNKTFGNEYENRGYSVQQIKNGDYIIVGYTKFVGEKYSYLYLLKTDNLGNEKWNKTFSKASSGQYINLTNDNGYIITGGVAGDVYLIKTDGSGNEIWNNTFGGSLGDYGNSVHQTTDGGYIITGTTSSFGAGLEDIWLIKTNSNGNEKWNKTFGGLEKDWGISVQQTIDSGYIITGYTYSYGIGMLDLILIKTDQNGNEQWNRTYGSNGRDQGYSVIQDSNNDFIVLGMTSSYGAGNLDVWLIKTNQSGNVQYTNGEFTSTNLCLSQNPYLVDTFKYHTSIPPDTCIKAQFSKNKLEWYNSVGIENGWDLLINGSQNIDLTSLSWFGSSFYYKMNFSSNNLNTPALNKINISYKQYLSSGSFISSPFDTGSERNWNALSWLTTEPVGTEVKFQIRTSDFQDGLSAESFVGPNGKSSTFYLKPNELIWSGHDYDNWIQFKAYLSTNNISQTPILEEVSISLNYLPNPPILNEPKNQSLITNKRPVFEWIFDDFESNQQLGFQWQMDDAVNFSSIDFDSGEISSGQTSYTPTLQIPDGVWYWRVRTQDHDGDWGTFSDYFGVIIDTTIDSPVNLTLSPDDWTAINSFTVSWENPFDPAGIAGAYYKLDTPPGANDDGIYFPGIEINTINGISVSNDGEHTIYIWLRDNLDNVNYNNHSSAKFYLDSSAPLSPDNITVTPNTWTSINSFSINWLNPMELSGIKNGAYYYIGLKPPNSQSDGTWVHDKPMVINRTIEGEYHLYLWLEDNLGNKNFENHGIVVLKLDTISPKITHTPVNNGVDREEIMITAEATDEHSGINGVSLHFKKPNESSYNTISMNKNESIYSVIIPKDDVTANGLEYYIKAFDRSSPNNVIYYGKNGETEVEPTSENDIDIVISGVEKHTQTQMDMMIYGIAGLVIIIVVSLIIIFLVIRGKKKQRSPQPTMNAPKQPVEMKIPISPEQKSITPKTAIEQQPQQPYFAPQQTQRTFTCERCGTIINDPNKCQYCGWTRQF